MEKPSVYRGLRAHVAYWHELLRQDGTNLSRHLIDTCQDQWVSAVFEADEQIYIEGLDDAMLTIAEMCKELMANTPKPVAVFPLTLVRDAISTTVANTFIPPNKEPKMTDYIVEFIDFDEIIILE